MYIQLISIHGLIRGENIEMGRDADTGGQVRYVLELARTLATFDEVQHVDLFTRQIRDKKVSDDYAQRIEPLGDKCRIVRLPCGGRRYWRKERLWPYLDEYVDAMISFTRSQGLAPSVVHSHYADAGYVGKEVAAAFGVPFLFTGHSLGRDKLEYLRNQGIEDDDIDREYHIFQRIEAEENALAVADRVVASTTHERDSQYKKYDRGDEPDFAIIPPGTGLERFFPYYDFELSPDSVDEKFKQARMRMADELARFHFNPDKPVILALCRPERRKNISSLVQAYGEDKELQALANLAIFAGIRKNIAEMEENEQQVLTDMLLLMDKYDLYGRMAIPKRHDSETEVPELYRLAASKKGIFVNPAYVEPFGLTFIESSAVGLPFVGTHNGGPQDIIANCESGLLVDVSDLGEMAKAMKRLLTDTDLWNNCSSNGINRVREHYSWETHCRTYLDTLSEVAAEPAKRARKEDVGMGYGKRLTQLDSLLIADIDNTLLGDDEALGRLMEALESERGHLGFGVATGRYLDMVHEALEPHGIQPDIIVSSVGTEIYYGESLTPDRGWASHLRGKWRPGRIHEALDNLDFLTLQKDEKTQREFKISYDLDDSVNPDEAIREIHAHLSKARAAYTLIFSHGTFIDILAPRASKGKAIRYLSAKWNIPLDNIATAGDSGNDREMLRGRTAGIVVGNYAEELESLRKANVRAYFAEQKYAAGILEGLEHYGLLQRAKQEAAS